LKKGNGAKGTIIKIVVGAAVIATIVVIIRKLRGRK